MGSIRWMHTRHEEVAAFAAGAEAAVTGKLAVCAGSCGPGNLHLINGLFDCHRNHVSTTDFAAIAKGAGIYSERVEHSEELAGALARAFAHPGPALVDVVTAKYELALPPKIQWAQAKGFSLYMLRAVLNGRGDEIVELANTNFR